MSPLIPNEIERRVIKMESGILAIVLAVLGGIALFLLTAILLIKGGPRVGRHLSLLGQYLPGYRVSWKGAFIGIGYGALIGGISGYIIAFIYNSVIHLRHRK